MRALEYLQSDPFFQVRGEVLPHEQDRSADAQSLIRTVVERFERVVESQKLPGPVVERARKLDEAGHLADLIVPYLTIPVADQQAILETLSPRERLAKVNLHLD
jgi:ATP-dependent Lon protease